MAKTVAQLQAEINATIIDNTTGAITPALTRNDLLDIINSYVNLLDGLPPSGVTPGTYGDSTHVAQVAIGADGLVTAASNVAISGGGAVSSVSNSDGTLTISPTTGAVVASARTATSSLLGVVKPDGSTITIAGGVISASGGGTSDGTLNVLDFGLVNDNSTDNAAAWTAFLLGLKAYGRSTTITGVTVASSIFTKADHGLQPGDGLYSLTTAGGVVSGTLYYVLSPQTGILTKNTFQLSSTNNELYNGETLVTVTGTATYSFQTSGIETIKIVFPPGGYLSSAGGFGFNCGVKSLDVSFNGAFMNALGVGDYNLFQMYGAQGHPFLWAYLSSSYTDVTSKIINVSVADAAKAVVGQMVYIVGGDTQSGFGGFPGLPSTPSSGPPNNPMFDIRRITAVNLGTGAITLDRTLSRCYLTTWPTFYAGIYPDGGPGTDSPANGGAACIYFTHSAWDSTRIFRGAHTTEINTQSATNCRNVSLYDFTFDGRGIYPSVSERVDHTRCVWKGSDIEFDKLVWYAGYHECTINNMNVQSDSVTNVVFDRGTVVSTCNGTSRNWTVKDGSRFDQLAIGPLGFGYTQSVLLEDASIGLLQMSIPFWAPQSSVYGNKLFVGYIGAYTYSQGILSVPMSTIGSGGPNSWAVNGAKMYFADYAGRYDNMGNPFEVTDVYRTASSGPTSIPVTAGVTATNVVITWAAGTSGDIVSFDGPASGSTWPFDPDLQLIPTFPFILINAGVAGANTFNLATLAAPTTPITSTGSPANLLAVLNPVFNIQTTLAGATLPLGNSSLNPITAAASVFTNSAGDLLVNWTTAPANDTPIIFNSTLALPVGITAGQPFWAVSHAANSVKVSTSKGGAPVAFSGAATGTITSVANPVQIFRHPCPDMTVTNCRGGYNSPITSVTSMNGMVHEPMYSRCRVVYGGLPDAPAVFVPGMYAWGNLTDDRKITINVLQPWTGAGTCTLTVTTNVSDQSTLIISSDVQTIDCTVGGIRTISNSGVTGAAGAAGGNPGDTIAAITKWLTGVVIPAFTYGTGGGSDTSKSPLVSIEILTDQGITKINNVAFVPSGGSHTELLIGDSITVRN